MSSTPRQPSVESAAQAAIPARIGRYQLRNPLASGSSAAVYLGYDEELQRTVAIKIIHPHLLESDRAAELFQMEARVLARLDHPGIVPVYDVGRSDEGLYYLVSKFIEGNDLKRRIEQDRPGAAESAALVAAAAEALHHAHQCGLVHRDIKPANIILDRDGRPIIADFGMALTREAFGTGPIFVGTPSYMSPEQARRESHRVDARTDIYSLGAVLYELLTGRPPFQADTREALLEAIKHQPPTPPRDLDPNVPAELERICLKALAKRAADRYAEASDFAEELRHWQSTTNATTQAEQQATAPAKAVNIHSTVMVVPRGLRAFTLEDAEFFVSLLPGPRERDGLPNSISFWKRRIESTRPELAFRIGVLYGPSGGGKSSLLRAGLLPRLNANVHPVVVEAAGSETESRLLLALRNQVAGLPASTSLAETLTALRLGNSLPSGHKVLLVIDQFEQWLHAAGAAKESTLVEALRQCDGIRVQCLLLVRDDFWMSVARFMKEVEAPLVDGETCAAVDRFDVLHARAVLAEFGRAYGRLPDRTVPLSPDQARFLDEAIDALSEQEAVTPVKLALFTEMVKGRPWNAETLQRVGGARGVGVAFLEDRLGARTAPAPYRPHCTGARAVLGALLPEAGADIRGAARSVDALRESAGYAADPSGFEELLRILDSELRLLTPVPDEKAGRRYQLTHDYLVPALREWLTRQQRETRRGRAQLCLAERAAAWSTRRESRQLPSAREWLRICLLTRSRDWTAPQRDMMRQATRQHLIGTLIVVSAGLLLAWGGFEVWERYQERARRQRLLRPELTPEAREYLRELDFSDLVTSMPGVFYLKDRNGVYIYANDAWTYFQEEKEARLVPGTNLIGKTDFDMPWKADAEMLREQDKNVMATGKTQTFRYLHRSVDGSPTPFLNLKAPLRNRHGQIIGIIGYSMPEGAK